LLTANEMRKILKGRKGRAALPRGFDLKEEE